MKPSKTVATRGRGFLWLVAGLFVLLGLGYSSLTPIFENSDETLHYPYVKHLADGRGLPVAEPGQAWNQEGTQPPLYYAIVAATTFWLDTDNLADHLQRNPHWLFTEVRALLNDNQNLLLHGPQDIFPYRQTALAVHIGRGWSLLFGLITVICTFLIARHLFPTDLPLAVSATALTALTPQFLRVSATVSNDSLAAALAALTVWLALKLTEPRYFARPLPTQPHQPRQALGFKNQHALLLGGLAGLALLTKLSSLSTFLLVAFILFWRLFFVSEIHHRPLAHLLRWLLFSGAVLAGLSGWWFWRNYQLYGEWLATEIHLNLAGRGHLSLADIWQLRAEVERAYWATFGWGQIRLPEWLYRLLGWFSRLGLLGLGLAVLARLVQGDRRWPLPLSLKSIELEKIIFLTFWAGLNLALYLRWVMEVGSVSHTRLIFPAITAISLLLGLGWQALLPARLASGFSSLLLAGLVGLNIYSLGWLLYPAYRPDPAEATPPSQPVELTFADSLTLTAGQVYPGLTPPASPLTRPAATADQPVTIRVEWQVLAQPDRNYSVAALLLAPDGQPLARRETYPSLGLRPTRYLAPGQHFIDRYPLRIDASINEPLVAQAVVTLFEFDSAERAGLPALNDQGQPVTPVVGRIKLVPEPWPTYQPAQPAQVTFAETVTLTGYDLTSLPKSTGQPGGYQLSLYWRVQAPLEEDYNLFIHLLDKTGQVLAQADAPPTHNRYPTSWWVPGELIADHHSLPDPAGAAQVRLGWYSLASGQRLPITQSSLPSQDNGLEIVLP